jgi:nucleoside 2-deoxyribosyltransferase
MRAFLSTKFTEDDTSRQQVKEVITAIEAAGAEVYCFRRDAENWGDVIYRAEEMMEITFKEINKSDVLIADVTDWPIGVGVEAGYAYAKGKPIICICKRDKRLANTVTGLTNYIIRYTDSQSLNSQIKSIFTQQAG